MKYVDYNVTQPISDVSTNSSSEIIDDNQKIYSLTIDCQCQSKIAKPYINIQQQSAQFAHSSGGSEEQKTRQMISLGVIAKI